MWKNDTQKNIFVDVQEMGLVRFYQDQFRTKVNMGLDLYDWLTSTDRLKKGKKPVSTSAAFIMSSSFSFLLLYCGVFSDIFLLI